MNKLKKRSSRRSKSETKFTKIFKKQPNVELMSLQLNLQNAMNLLDKSEIWNEFQFREQKDLIQQRLVGTDCLMKCQLQN